MGAKSYLMSKQEMTEYLNGKIELVQREIAYFVECQSIDAVEQKVHEKAVLLSILAKVKK